MPFKLMRYRELMQKLLTVDTLEERLSQIVREVEAEIEFQSLGVFIYNETHGAFRLKISRNLSHSYTKRTEYLFDDDIVRRLQHGHALHSTDPADVPYEKEYTHLVALPLRFKNELLGFIFMDNAERMFTDEEIALLEIFAALCSLSAQVYRQAHIVDSLTQFDTVTGLFTYRHFHQRADVSFQQARRYGHQLSMLVLKFGKYKEVYRKLGASEASRIMSTVAESLKENLRVMEVIGVIYPDTVSILLPDSPAKDIEMVVARLQNTVFELAAELESAQLAWGVASISADYQTVDDLIRAAEEAAFEAVRQPGPLRLVARIGETE